MKIIFVFLLTVNITWLIFAQSQAYLVKQKATDKPVQINPEKIVLVPRYVNCLKWGNFPEEQLPNVEAVLAESFPEWPYQWEGAGETSMYWLYIPNLANKESATRVFNKLRNLGIASFRMKDHQWENAISLGMFYNQADALKQLQEIEEKGIANVKMESRVVMLKQIVIQDTTQVFEEQILKLTGQFDNTRLVKVRCERL